VKPTAKNKTNNLVYNGLCNKMIIFYCSFM